MVLILQPRCKELAYLSAEKSHDAASYPHPPSVTSPSASYSPDPPLTACHDRPLQYETVFFVPPLSRPPSVDPSLPSQISIHTSLSANGSQCDKKREQNCFKHVDINPTSTAPFSPFPPDGLHYFIHLRANARDHAETEDFFPLSMKRIAKSSAIQHHRLSHQHEHWIHMLQQKLLARELRNLGPQIQLRGESQFQVSTVYAGLDL